jgi:hypothetical protein
VVGKVVRYSGDVGVGAGVDEDGVAVGRSEIEASLIQAGYTTLEVRQAPDRPDLEYVFIARTPTRDARD